jgi:hypothetical protein
MSGDKDGELAQKACGDDRSMSGEVINPRSNRCFSHAYSIHILLEYNECFISVSFRLCPPWLFNQEERKPWEPPWVERL